MTNGNGGFWGFVLRNLEHIVAALVAALALFHKYKKRNWVFYLLFFATFVVELFSRLPELLGSGEGDERQDSGKETELKTEVRYAVAASGKEDAQV